MAVSRRQQNTPTEKLTLAQARQKVTELQEKIDKFEKTARCPMCGKFKDIESKFYLDTDPVIGGMSYSRICRECAKGIALRRDKNGEDHEPTKESVIKALKYLNKPFINTVWNASIQESENLVAGKVKHNVWNSYIKNIQMIQYVGLTFFDSDFYKEHIIYDDEKTESQIIEEHAGLDTYDSFVKNKEDVKRLLNYDPFEKEEIGDQPFLYSQLLGLLDASEDANEDMMRTASAISIVRGFLQQSKIDDTVAKLMSDILNIEKNSATIKSLQDSKSKITSVITSLAQDSCISLKHSKNASKGDNTWTGKIKKIRDLNLRDGEVNGFDIATCRGMQQVQELSDASIMKQLALDESDWSDMVAEMRIQNVDLQKERDAYKELNRILLRENLDLKDLIEESKIVINRNTIDLKNLYSVFGDLNSPNEEEKDA